MNARNTFPLFFIGWISLILCAGSCTKTRFIPMQDQLVGKYTVEETCDYGKSNYWMAINKLPNTDKGVMISNFGGYLIDVKALVTADGFTFQSTHDSIRFAGSGILEEDGKTLIIFYTATDGIYKTDCSMICRKE